MGRTSSKKAGRKSKPYKGPFPQNKNFTYQTVRKNMKMPADGPTIDEVSPMDTTSSSSDIDELRLESVGGRPVKRTVAMQNWLLENLKGIIVGVISTLFAGFCVRIAITHSEKLAAHEKDIEHLEETISNHDDKIERLQEGTNTLNTDLRLLEQRVDLTKDSGKPTKK